MTGADLPDEVLAAIAAMTPAKRFKDAKGALAEGDEVSIDTTVRIKGELRKGKSRTRSSKNPAINPYLLLAAALEGATEEKIREVFERARSESFQEAYDAAGGDGQVHADLAEGMGLPAMIEKEVAGSVSGKDIEIVEAVDRYSIYEAIEESADAKRYA